MTHVVHMVIQICTDWLWNSYLDEMKNIKIFSFYNFKKKILDENLFLASFSLFSYTALPTIFLTGSIFYVLKNFYPEAVKFIGPGQQSEGTDFFPLLIFNPVFESFILALAVKLLLKIGLKAWSLFLSAMFIAGIHSLQNFFWGVTLFLYFFIQAYAFFICLEKGFKKAFFTIWLSHFLHNLCVWMAITLLGNSLIS